MGIFGIFGGGNKSNYYNYLLNFYEGFSSTHHLEYRQKSGGFQVMARYGPHPWPGIKVHTPLSDKIYNVLMDQGFQQMMMHGKIDGFKIFENPSHKQVTFYISFHFISGYKELLHIFRAHGIHVEPNLRHDNNGNVLLNRMYIAKDIYVRYSIDFYGEKKDHPKIDDSNWRSAEDHGHPQIWAVSKKYILDNLLYKLAHEDSSNIYTFLTLERYGIQVPIPRVILSLGYNTYKRLILKAYLIDEDRIVYYDPYNEEHTKDIVENPKQALENFLKS